MHLQFSAAILALALSTGMVGVLQPSSLSAQAVDQNVVAGAWIGRFGSSDWTFEFKKEAGNWSGRYMSAKDGKWHALQNVRVSDRTISFNVVSRPQLAFALSVDASDQAMSGSVTIPSGMGMPFSAVRKS